MVRLVVILLGVDYLRTRWGALTTAGWISLLFGIAVFIDALDSALYFPVTPFACLLLLEGLATLAVAWTGMGGQRTLRYVKGLAFCVAALLILIQMQNPSVCQRRLPRFDVTPKSRATSITYMFRQTVINRFANRNWG